MGYIFRVRDENGDFVAIPTLVGPRGATGPQGEKGETGAKGTTGATGATGVGISSVEQTTTSTEDGGENIVTVTLTDETAYTFSVRNGSKGADGYTPVKGTDYFGEADKKEIAEAAAALIELPTAMSVETIREICGRITSDLPLGYTKLRYIRSTGTQYIDTGFKPSSNTRVVMDIENLYAGQKALFGARDSSSANSNLLWAINATAFRSDYFASTTDLKTINVDTVTGRYTIDKNKNVCTAKGVTGTNTAVSFSCSYNMFLFALNTAGTAHAYRAIMRLYSCQIYESDVLVRDYVPCINPSGVYGLYDKVNGAFYGDAAGGAFVCG